MQSSVSIKRNARIKIGNKPNERNKRKKSTQVYKYATNAADVAVAKTQRWGYVTCVTSVTSVVLRTLRALRRMKITLNAAVSSSITKF